MSDSWRFVIIGIDARFFGPRGKGLGRYTQKLIESLEELDDQNDYVIFLRRENFDEYRAKNKNFKKVLADYRWYSLAEQIYMPFLIAGQGIDLMHFPHFNVPVFYFGPYVVTIHDLILRHFSTRRASTLGPAKYWFKNLVYRVLFRLIINRAKKIITVSGYVKKDLIKCFGLKQEKIVVTHEGAPEKYFNPPAPLYERGDSEVAPLLKGGEGGLKTKIFKPYLLYVGNAYPHKNLENLIEAFGILIKKYKKNLQLVLVGEEDYFYLRLKSAKIPILQSMESFADQVIFTGFVSDEKLLELYQGASAYVFPSLCEGFGLPPLEAMACGAPVVCSNATCLPEILGTAAAYFDPLSPSDMAQKINNVLENENLRRNLINNGFEQIKRYSWREMGKNTLRIYMALVQRES